MTDAIIGSDDEHIRATEEYEAGLTEGRTVEVIQITGGRLSRPIFYRYSVQGIVR